jgi:[ribosomal protein S5]-alanine N-acetyltransferase
LSSFEDTSIESERLELVALGVDFLTASLNGDRAAAERLLGATIHSEWFDHAWLLELRLKQLHENPELDIWLLKAIVERSSRTMVGHIGFHTAPGPDYLGEIAPDGVELGYTIYSPFRRQGYAGEACEALMRWAHEQHGVTTFVVSISPTNLPSQRIAQRFGFEIVTTVEDEEDGVEEVYVLKYPPQP